MTDVPYQIYRHNNIERAAVAMPMWGSLRLAPTSYMYLSIVIVHCYYS